MGGQALPYDATTRSIARLSTVFPLCPAKDMGHVQRQGRENFFDNFPLTLRITFSPSTYPPYLEFCGIIAKTKKGEIIGKLNYYLCASDRVVTEKCS